MKRNHLLLALIVAFGFLLRVAYLGKIPAGFTPDEASQGYAAYSLLQTGKDEWGVSWPLTSFRAFADYRAPLQTYLIIPSIAIFGLNEFAVRFPSALFGTLAILAVYLLANKLFSNKSLVIRNSSLDIGVIAAAMIAISPWHIQFSRTALEANFTSFLFPFGLYLLLRGLEKPKALLFAALVFGLDLYSYLAAKLFIPLFLIGFAIFYRRELAKVNRKFLALAATIFLLFAAPIYLDTLFGPGNTRGKDLIITNLSKENLDEISQIQYLSPLNRISPQITRILTNKLTFIIDKFVENYLSYLSLPFWFTEGGRETTYSVIPGRGLLYFWMIIPVSAGLFYLLSKHRELRLILLWLMLGIIPAALTKEGYRPNRAASLLTLWELVAAVGAFYWLTKLSQNHRKIILYVSGVIIVVFSASYLYDYAYASSVKSPDALVYGYRDVVAKVSSRQDKFNTIIVDRGSQSQVFFAFYGKVDPGYYQEFAKDWWPQVVERKLLFLDMLDGYQLGKFIFKSFNITDDLKPGNLVIIPARKINPDLRPYIIDTVVYPDRRDAFYLLSK
jgi:4-amino-4-deoxy-L-arabinose transferase-like glycosyltransferase